MLTTAAGGVVVGAVVATLPGRLQHQYDTANTGPPEAVRMVDTECIGGRHLDSYAGDESVLSSDH